MIEAERIKQVFVAYEYKEIAVERRYAREYADGYANFGWELEDAYESTACTPGLGQEDELITLHLKRDRRIMNKMELTRLQRQFEACMREVQSLKTSCNLKATLRSLILGIVGFVLVFGSVFASILSQAFSWAGILFDIPGVACCALAFPVYQRVHKKRSAEVEPLLDAKYDEICMLCEKGHRLCTA